MKSVLIFKALADPSRLAIYKQLLEKPAYVEILSERLNLAASTVSFHLKKLTAAGLVSVFKDQYYSVYKAKPLYAEMTLGKLIESTDLGLIKQDRAEADYNERILKSFFKYGKLLRLPVQKKKREVVLKKIAENFAPSKKYNEIEIDDLLGQLFSEPSVLRKELTLAKYLVLNDGCYQRMNLTNRLKKNHF